MKVSKAKLDEFRAWWVTHNKEMKRTHQDTCTFEEFLDRIYGRKKVKESVVNHIPSYTYVKRNEGIKSLDTMAGDTSRKESSVYSGSRKLVGIGTMHKSNMVPVFSDEEAEDISKMRRG